MAKIVVNQLLDQVATRELSEMNAFQNSTTISDSFGFSHILVCTQLRTGLYPKFKIQHFRLDMANGANKQPRHAFVY